MKMKEIYAWTSRSPSFTNSRISNIYEAFTVRHKFGGVLNRNVYVVRSVVRHFTGRNIVRILAIVHCIDLNADVLKVNAGLGK